MDKQAQDAKEMVKQMSFREKLKHFWYYYKIHTIVILFVALLTFYTVWQATHQPHYDLTVAYYGGMLFEDEKLDALKSYLEGVIEDVDGDGKVTVKINKSIIGNPMSNDSYDAATMQKFWAEIAANVNPAYILDENMQKMLVDGDMTKDGGIDEIFNLKESKKANELLGLGETSVYWATMSQNESEDALKNARLAAEALKSFK